MSKSPEPLKTKGSVLKTSPEMMELLKERWRIRKRRERLEKAQVQPNQATPPNSPAQKSED